MAATANDGEFGFQIAPMLDVLFVLLLFFMVVAGAQKIETNLSVPLPGRGQSPEPKIPVVLEIAADGQVTFNGVATDALANHQLPETMSRLKAVLADAPERPVIIQPAPTARHQRVMDVLDMCQAIHARNVVFGPNQD
jgi:biopolymer transport protein ExbD